MTATQLTLLDSGEAREPVDAPPVLLVDVVDAARMLRCGRTVVYQLISDGRLATVKLGRLRRIPTAELCAFVERSARRGV